MSDDAERERRVAEVVRKTAVLHLPGMDQVQVRREQAYGDGSTFDLYVAAGGAPAATVLFVYGFPDPRFAQGLRQMGGYTSWGRLLAAWVGVRASLDSGPGGTRVPHDLPNP